MSKIFDKVEIFGTGTGSTTNGLTVKDSGGTTNLVVTDNAHVGIGTASPTAKLHVVGTSNSTGTIGLQTESLNGNGWFRIYDDGTLWSQGLSNNTHLFDVLAGNVSFTFDSPAIQYLEFKTSGVIQSQLINQTNLTRFNQAANQFWGVYGSDNNPYILFDETNKYVGISTLTPAFKLDVVGAINTNNGFWHNGNRLLQSDSFLGNNFVGSYAFNATPGQTGIYVNAMGYNAAQSNTGDYVIGIGNSSALGNTGTIVDAIGTQAAQGNSGNNVIAVGYQSAIANTGSNIIALGPFAADSNILSDAVIIGRSRAAANGFLEMWLGVGANKDGTEAMHPFSIRQGSIKNGIINQSMVAVDLNIVGAVGTGTGLGGDVTIKVAPAGVSSDTQNTLVTAVTVKQDGNVGIATSSPNTRLDISGDVATRVVSPASFSTDQNNFPTTNTSFVRLNNISGSSVNLTGFANGYDGKRLVVTNVSTGASSTIILIHDSANSSVGNKLFIFIPSFGSVGDYTLNIGEAVQFIYDPIDGYWRKIN